VLSTCVAAVAIDDLSKVVWFATSHLLIVRISDADLPLRPAIVEPSLAPSASRGSGSRRHRTPSSQSKSDISVNRDSRLQGVNGEARDVPGIPDLAGPAVTGPFSGNGGAKM
jgi:hypothetical protein